LSVYLPIRFHSFSLLSRSFFFVFLEVPSSVFFFFFFLFVTMSGPHRYQKPPNAYNFQHTKKAFTYIHSSVTSSIA
jgi:hypothetical protein